LDHFRAGERLVLSGAVAGEVEVFGGLGVGVVVEELVEQFQGRWGGLPGLPGVRRDRDRQAGVGSAAESDVQVDLIVLDHGDVADQ